ncbi:MAG: hypothetical protein AAFQ37_14475 [Bacteroidota bacterium]
MIGRLLITLVLLGCTPYLVKAQSGGGSPYSSIGYGDLNLIGSGLNRGFAGQGVAVRSDIALNYRNPASYTSLQQPFNVIFDIGLDFSINQVKTNSEQLTRRDGGLSNLVFWLRPGNHRWATTIGILPYSRVKYSILTEQSDGGVNGSYQTINEGTGGLSKLFWGHGYQLTRNFSLGVNGNLYFGDIKDEATVFTSAATESFGVSTNTTLQGFNLDAGLQFLLKPPVPSLMVW